MAGENPFVKLVFWTAGFTLAGYVANSLFNRVEGVESFSFYFIESTGGPDGWGAQAVIFLGQVVDWYVRIATIVCALFVLGIVYAYMRWYSIRKAEKKRDQSLVKKTESTSKGAKSNAKWEKVVAHVLSENPAEWRLAILEADVLLEEVLESAGYKGETLGDKLKAADFQTIQYAWDAHKIRNAIAHEGADFLITQREAKRVIGMYEQVFKELAYV